MTDPDGTSRADHDLARIEWHQQESGHQVVVSVDGNAVRIAVALSEATTRSALEAAWAELIREIDHFDDSDRSPVRAPS